MSWVPPEILNQSLQLHFKVKKQANYSFLTQTDFQTKGGLYSSHYKLNDVWPQPSDPRFYQLWLQQQQLLT